MEWDLAIASIEPLSDNYVFLHFLRRHEFADFQFCAIVRLQRSGTLAWEILCNFFPRTALSSLSIFQQPILFGGESSRHRRADQEWRDDIETFFSSTGSVG
jgi:hypothetical protein